MFVVSKTKFKEINNEQFNNKYEQNKYKKTLNNYLPMMMGCQNFRQIDTLIRNSF